MPKPISGDNLIEACTFGNVEAVKFLLKQGEIDINRTNSSGETALMKAAQFGQFDVVEALLQHGADVQAKCSPEATGYSSALLRAASNGHSSVVKLLLTYKADANETDSTTGYTAFMLACKCGSQETMKTLVIHGAKVNIKAKDGSTALQLARDDDIAVLVQSQLVPPFRPVQVILFISFAIGLGVGYLLSFLPKPLRNS